MSVGAGLEPPLKKPATSLYLGLDFSTQQLKAVCVGEDLTVTHEFSVVYDEDLPEFKTEGGVHYEESDHSVTTPTIMWVKAWDMLLEKMASSGFPFHRVAGIGGSGQQHGSVYWKRGSGQILANLDATLSLQEQLQSSFSVTASPIWKDSSTTSQCRQLEEKVGGAEELARHTGSRAYERFTGNQIAKIFQNSSEREEYRDFPSTERISLVSSFGATLMLGKYADIDYSDGSGMNLMDIKTKDWWQDALDACAPELRTLLGQPVPTNTCLGCVSDYYVQRYKFPSDCKIAAFTGDNPASLAGMRLERGDVVVSLGTSDTLFLWIDEAVPQLTGHVFVNPVDKDAYMALLCYKNGSKAREKIRNDKAGGDWEEFNKLLGQTKPGNEGNIGLYFLEPEITPTVHDVRRFTPQDESVDSFPAAVEVRAIVEGQIMAKRCHALNLGYQITSRSRVLATGGAAVNPAIRQIIADIFNCNVYILTETVNSASLGGAYIAKRVAMGANTTFQEATSGGPRYELANTPGEGARAIYEPLLARYSKLEASLSD